MSLYDDDVPMHREYRERWRRLSAKVTAELHAEHKARDPLDFYWKRGVRALRDTHKRLLDFQPTPEQFYNEGKYR